MTTTIYSYMNDIMSAFVNGLVYIHIVYIIKEVLFTFHHFYNKLNPIEIVLFASNFYNHLQDFMDVYTPDIVKTGFNHALYYYQSTRAYLGNYRMEPQEPYWISLSWISILDNSKYNDIYHYYPSFTGIITIIENMAKTMNPITLTNEVVLYISNQGKRIVRICYQRDNTIKQDDDIIFHFFKNIYNHFEALLFSKLKTTKSNVRFLAVTYTHPDMDEKTLDLTVGPEYFIEGNEILSYTFISRLLEYQSDKKHVFDTNYVVQVMDHDIQTFELNSNQYVKLGMDDYQIITL